MNWLDEIDETASQSMHRRDERNVEIFIELALIQYENIRKKGFSLDWNSYDTSSKV